MKPKNNEAEADITQVLGLDYPSRKGKKILRRLIVPILLVMAIVIAVIIWRTSDKADATQYKTQDVHRGNLTVTVTATGTVEPTNQVDVGSELSGIIETVEVDYNDRVTAGQVLGKLDPSKLQAQVLKSKAALKAAKARVWQSQATVRETQNELSRLKQVLEISRGKVPSRHEMDAAEAALQRAQADEVSAKAAVSEAQATLDANETDLKKAVIRSPVNGVILVRAIEPGQTVAASLQAPVLFTIAEDLTKMELHVDVDEADVGQVSEGQAANFTVDAYPDRTYSAHITQVRFGSQKVEGVVTYESVMSVDNTDLSLRPGMTATADIIVNKIENAVLVPNAALRFAPQNRAKMTEDVGFIDKLISRRRRRTNTDSTSRASINEGPRVWVVTKDSKLPVRSFPVKTGPTDGSYTAIVDGSLEPGQQVIVGMETVNE